jgi:hypothetical protein
LLTFYGIGKLDPVAKTLKWEILNAKEAEMSKCWCRCVLAVLVIVFAWLPGLWANIALTILGAVLAVLALVGTCCCTAMCEQVKSETSSETDK